jgi:hypothetical protein
LAAWAGKRIEAMAYIDLGAAAPPIFMQRGIDWRSKRRER